MTELLRKEYKLCASALSYWFILFAAMFLLPGYPVLCGAFFVTLGIFQSFIAAVSSNDIVFSSLLPITKKDIVKGKFLFSCSIELFSFILMLIATIIRMTVFRSSEVYLGNALMNANPFALGCALVIFSLFNRVFISSFFKSAYKLTNPFVSYVISCFLFIFIAEAAHYLPGFEALNSFGFDNIGLQLLLLISGIVIYIAITFSAYKKACRFFDKLDL